MAELKISKGSEEWEMFRDFWDLYKKYGKPEQSSEYWNEVVQSVGKFSKKYNSVFANKLGEALFEELEFQAQKKAKQLTIGGGKHHD